MDDSVAYPSPSHTPEDNHAPPCRGNGTDTQTRPDSVEVSPKPTCNKCGQFLPETPGKEHICGLSAREKSNLNLRPFVKGDPRLQKLVKRKEEARLKRMAREHCQEAIETLVELMRFSRSPKVRKDAATEILDRGLGKPKQVDYTQEVDEDTGEELADIVVEAVLDKYGTYQPKLVSVAKEDTSDE